MNTFNIKELNDKKENIEKYPNMDYNVIIGR